MLENKDGGNNEDHQKKRLTKMWKLVCAYFINLFLPYLILIFSHDKIIGPAEKGQRIVQNIETQLL